MPIWLRLYTFRAIEEFYVKEKESQEEAFNKQNNIQKASPTNQIPVPPAPKKNPTYSTNVSKK